MNELQDLSTSARSSADIRTLGSLGLAPKWRSVERSYRSMTVPQREDTRDQNHRGTNSYDVAQRD